MSLLILATYLQKQMGKEDKLHKLVEAIACKIEENDNLEKEERNIWEDNCRMSMDIFTLEQIEEQRKDDIEHMQLCEDYSRNTYGNFIQLSNQLKAVGIEKLLQHSLQEEQFKLQIEIREMEQSYQSEQELCLQMENREIVKQLRQQQQDYDSALAQVEKTKQMAESIQNSIWMKLKSLEQKRNEKVIILIKGSKDLTELRNEIKFKKEATKKSILHEETQDKVENKNTQSAALVPSLKFNFFKIANIKTQKLPTFDDFKTVLQATSLPQIPNRNSSNPTSKHENASTNVNSEMQNTQKHVQFLLESSDVSTRKTLNSASTSSSSPSSSMDNGQHSETFRGNQNSMDIDVVGFSENLNKENQKPIDRTSSDTASKIKDGTVDNTIGSIVKYRKDKVEILEQIFVKPHGLPKKLPLSEANFDQIKKNEFSSENVETDSTIKTISDEECMAKTKGNSTSAPNDFELLLNSVSGLRDNGGDDTTDEIDLANETMFQMQGDIFDSVSDSDNKLTFDICDIQPSGRKLDDFL